MDEVEKYFYSLDNNEELPTKKFSWKKFVFGTLAFAIIATALKIYQFSLPFISGITKVEFSAAIVMLCFFLLGPWSALIVMLTKSLVYYFIYEPKLISVALDVFMTVVMILVCYFVINKFNSTNIVTKTIVAGLLATVIVCISVSAFNYYIYYPVVEKHYNVDPQNIVRLYNNHFSYINSTTKSILLFDGPWYASKVLLGTMISAVAVKIKDAME